MHVEGRLLLTAPLLSATAAALFLVSGAAFSQQGYIGAGYGATENQDIGYGDDTDEGWKAFLGGNVGRVFGFEAGYVDLGSFGGEGPGEVDAQGWTIDLVASVPAGPVLPFLKVGTIYADIDRAGIDDQSWELKYGAGIGFDFTPNIGMRVEYERFQVDDNDALLIEQDIDMASVSLVGKFGP